MNPTPEQETRAREIAEKIVCTPGVTSRADRTSMWSRLIAQALADEGLRVLRERARILVSGPYDHMEWHVVLTDEEAKPLTEDWIKVRNKLTKDLAVRDTMA